MLKISKSLRLKRRYILVKGDRKEIESAILDYIGALGWARASVMFLKKLEDKWIVAVNRGELVNIRAALALSKEKIDVLKASGTLRGLKNK